MTSTNAASVGNASHDSGEAAKALRFIPLGEQKCSAIATAHVADILSRE